ncbi:hypothetical protein [uncultured Acinetobacter sp.]|uniref:hypothetical protein n=1 Tax=uncultured Acinetobacter sp. TaxID=165433 RepID=UPI0025F32DE1|nr:hypothetical protein [uncultured Acinetobacter sp.]
MNTATKIIQFPMPQSEPQQEVKGMYSDRFKNGYVMSSRMYHEEVWPFLSDAARNVYAELEYRIYGHNKEFDSVSYSQLQGGSIPGSRQLARKTISAGLKELLTLGVITLLQNGKQGTKSYQINDISLVQQFTSGTSQTYQQSTNGTSSNSELVPVVVRNQSTREIKTSSRSRHTIEYKTKEDKEDDKAREEKFKAQENRPLNFVEYHPLDRTAISFPELCKKYPAQLDFQDQAKASFPNHSPDRIFENLKKMAQWSLDKSNHTPQKWMTIWLDTFMKNMPTDAEQATQQARQTKKSNSQPSNQKNQRKSRFGQYLKSEQTQQSQGGTYDV